MAVDCLRLRRWLSRVLAKPMSTATSSSERATAVARCPTGGPDQAATESATPDPDSNLAVLGATCDGGHPIATNPDPKCGATAEQLSSPCGANPAGSASDDTEIQGGSTPAARLTPYAPLSGGPGEQESTRSGVENRTNAGAGKIDTDMGDLLVPTSIEHKSAQTKQNSA